MKILGVLLVLLGGLGAYFQWRRWSRLPLCVGRALLEDLTVLRYEVCVRRAALPEILQKLSGGEGGRWLWGPLAARLDGDADIARCWAETAGGLPPPLDQYLAPLGRLLPAGGGALSAAVEEAREELTGFLRAEEGRQASQGRLAAAVCLSGASLLILALV